MRIQDRLRSSSQNEPVEEVAARGENLDELINKVVSYEEECKDASEEPTLPDFLRKLP